MKVNSSIGLLIGAGMCVALSGCGGGDPMAPQNNSMQPPPSPPPTSEPQPMMFSVNDVLGLARAQSETDDPVPVAGATVTPSDDETSDPVGVE